MAEENKERVLGPGAAGDPDNPGDPTTPVTEEQQQAERLRGRELDEALEEAGLPKSGTVAEKRQRLAQSPQAQSHPQHVQENDGEETH